MEYEYDITLSFAGEEREYIDQVAMFLKSNGLRVAYDYFDEVTVWGKDLTEHFDDIYRKKAKYCIMFISKHYADKAWPNFEKRSALAREVFDQGYILPARFDDTEILGLPPSKAYIDLRQKTPQQLANLIIKKLGKSDHSKKLSGIASFRRPKVSKSFDPYKESQAWLNYLVSELKKRCNDSEISFSHFSRDGKECLRFVISGKPVYSINIELGGFHRDHGLSFSYADGEMQMISGYNAFADFEWDKERKCIVLKLNDFSTFSSISGSDQNLTQQEFLEYIWDKICNAVEEEN